MADIKLKPVSKLETWNPKELRKLRIELNNRISSLEKSPKPKTLGKNHPLFEMELGECKDLLSKVILTEKKMSKN